MKVARYETYQIFRHAASMRCFLAWQKAPQLQGPFERHRFSAPLFYCGKPSGLHAMVSDSLR